MFRQRKLVAFERVRFRHRKQQQQSGKEEDKGRKATARGKHNTCRRRLRRVFDSFK
jgi:hypothetical protein